MLISFQNERKKKFFIKQFLFFNLEDTLVTFVEIHQKHDAANLRKKSKKIPEGCGFGKDKWLFNFYCTMPGVGL